MKDLSRLKKDLDKFKVEDQAGLKTASDLAEKERKSKGGRPPKKEKDKLKNRVTVYFTDAEIISLQSKARPKAMTDLIRQALQEKGYIKKK